MTTNKKLKRAVRTRMTKTGERYAAARRSLLDRDASVAPRDARLLPGYRRVGGSVVEISALANALAAAGVRAPHDGEPYSDALLYGLGGGVGGGYFMFQYGGAPTVAVIGTRHLWHDGAAFIGGILDRIGVRHATRQFGGRRTADAALDAALAAGHPCLAWVDRASLPHAGLPAELKRSMAWVVGVCGRVGDVLLLDDRAVRPFEIAAGVVGDARGLVGSARRRLIELEGPGGSIDLAGAALDAIRDGHAARLKPRIRNFGLPGIEKWASLVDDERDRKGWARTLTAPTDLVRALRWAYGSIAAGGLVPGSGGAGRDVYAAFIDEVASITGRPALASAADRYRSLADEWRDLADALLPDWIAPLGRIRVLERDRWAAFDRPDGPDLGRFRELTDRLEADGRAQMRALAAGAEPPDARIDIPEDARLALFRDLGPRIRAIYEAEVAASTELAEAAG